MFHKLDEIAHDDAVVKLLFDHIKNIGVSTLLLAAAAWKQKNIELGWIGLWDIFVGAILGFTGFSLIWINHENLFHKLHGSGISKWIKILIILLYSIIVVQLIGYMKSTH